MKKGYNAPAAPAVPVPVNTSNISSSSPMACSVCYGTGRDVAGKLCPFDCVPAVSAAPLVAMGKGHPLYDLLMLGIGEIAVLNTDRARGYAAKVREFLATYRPAPPSPSVDQAKRLVGGEVAAWVSVEDRLPSDGQSVNFVVKAGGLFKYLDGRVLGGTYSKHGFAIPGLVTGAYYWMPLPEAPDRASTGSATSTDTKESA